MSFHCYTFVTSKRNKMKTRKQNTRFMQGNIDLDGEIISILSERNGSDFILSDFDFDNAIYSNGFINAIESGLIPDFKTLQLSCNSKLDKEYHHLILNDECYIMYFN